MHDNTLIVSLILMSLVFLSFSFVLIRSGASDTPYSDIQVKGYRLRSKLFWIIIIAGVAIALATLRGLPFSTSQVANAVDINVKGMQWYWQMDKTSVEEGETVRFRVTSGDVNHGFGIYDDQYRMLGQIQAMPEYTNDITHLFDKAGTYKLMCMEYCGIAHHGMISDFTVTPTN